MKNNIKVTWEGLVSEANSLAIVNKNIVSRLEKNSQFQITSQYQSEQPPIPQDLSNFVTDNESKHFFISHYWPPRLIKPTNTKYWFSFLPWEFGAIPTSWYLPMKYEMDEVWVYSQYNKDCYIESGIPEEKISVIPLGVNETVYHADVVPAYFEEDERFRFLYVGGTITRKGFDLLLEAYTEEFTDEDEVCLVIKDNGNDTHYKGITLEKKIDEISSRPNSPAIVYINEHLSEDQLASLYRSCHCSIFPYRGEGFCLPIVESLACATPVIAPKLGPALEILGENYPLYIEATHKTQEVKKLSNLETINFPRWIEPNRIDLKRMMRYTYQNPKQVKEVGEEYSLYISTNYTWNKTVSTISEKLTTIASKEDTKQLNKPLSSTQIMTNELTIINNDVKNSQYDLALGKLRALIYKFPNNNNIRFLTAQIYIMVESYMEAISLLVPLSNEIQKEDAVEQELQYTQIWTLLGICYSNIQSWTLAIDAFNKAIESDKEMNVYKISYLNSALHSLSLLLGHIHNEIGDAYYDLNNDSTAKKMYLLAREYENTNQQNIDRIEKIEKKKKRIKEKLKPLLETEINKHMKKINTINWDHSHSEIYYPKYILSTCEPLFLPGHSIKVILPAIEDPKNSDEMWDGALVWIDSNLEFTSLIRWNKWCTNHIKLGSKIVIYTNDSTNKTYQNFCSLFSFGDWCEQSKMDDPKGIGEYTVFQRGGYKILWNSPYYNHSGYATEQKHFLQSLSPYPLLIGLDAIDAPTESKRSSLDVKLSTWFHTKEENPIIHYQAAPAHLFTLPRAPISIGRTMFETDRIPQEWVKKLNELSEIWVPSKFNIETFHHSGVDRNKLQIMPGAIDEAKFNRHHVKPYSLPTSRTFTFLSVFDWSIRKGWDILLKSYIESFTDEDDVTLVIKLSRINEPTAKVEQLINEIKQESNCKNPPHILLIDKEMTEDEIIQLYCACDVFVLPTRGEGWGRPFMEAMALEIPVIATNWSGHLEFMNETNSYLIEVEKLIPVPSSMPPHFLNHLWAQPSLEHLKVLMKKVVKDPIAAKQTAKKARSDLFPRYSIEEVGKKIYRRFDYLVKNYFQ
ncbi:glycosyltransferase [Bacillus weihaiensis]|uniref:glycosyltransferase n=1 Tax=Bacillus weihaiensis TaxID=1547283 RepID=UPI00235213F5|nr:glycosyltransferase [Bacillus weihaiensis]